MRSPSPSRSMSEVPGQSGHALPASLRRDRAMSGHGEGHSFRAAQNGAFELRRGDHGLKSGAIAFITAPLRSSITRRSAFDV